MEVYLAGYNVDTTILREMEEISGKRDDLTPEVLSAAYARISRDPRPINDIRKTSREEVERSRKSNSTIIFKMGHHSVAEHAVFNLDIIGVSRLAMEEVEKFRLCSYTEKSQRYITLDNDFVIPEEIKGTHLEKIFTDMIHRQNETYFEFFAKLKEYVFMKHPDLASDPKKHNLLEGWAKEDARYITALATESQVGATINARSLELLLRRFASHPLSEVKELGRVLYEKISNVAPSIVIFHQANERDLKTYNDLKGLAQSMGCSSRAGIRHNAAPEVSLVGYTEGADDIVAAALIHVSSRLSYEDCLSHVKNMTNENKKKIYQTAWRNMQFYDSMPREFEYVNLTFDIVLSAACFGQLKRHRMMTITSQPYDPDLGVTVPEAIKDTGLEKKFLSITDESAGVYRAIEKEVPLAAPYILTNAHRKRVLARLNARELYHISRLREDTHAQWDIHNISRDMTLKAKEVMPMLCGLIGGKDRYNEIYESVFGHMPKITEISLPQARSIK